MELFKNLEVKFIEDERLIGSKLQVVVSGENLLSAVRELYEKEFFLEDITSMEFKECFHILYRFNSFSEPGTITLRISIDKENPVIASISSIYQGALWHEREVYEFFGIDFNGHPDLKPLLLPAEDFEGCPLRKSDKTVKSIYDVFPSLSDSGDEKDDKEQS